MTLRAKHQERGGSVNYRSIGGLNEPPRLRELRWLREIFLVAQPPLLCRNCQATFCFHHRDWFSFATMRSAWAGDRAMLGSNPSADPGANTEAGYRYGYAV